MAEIQQAAIAAANWWTNQLAKPTFNSFKTMNASTSGYLVAIWAFQCKIPSCDKRIVSVF